jgi:hypothetical protein
MRSLFRRLQDWLLRRSAPPTEDDYLGDAGNWHALVSSNVEAAAYYFDVTGGRVGGTMAVRFLRRSGDSAEYAYDDVPLGVYIDFLASPSKGEFIWDHFRRPPYPFRRRR